ncbi:hypothetical protein PAHAL_5G042500 [Panicum hallii]|uniref:Neprosin PEP catalytic domain-containing protein n=1 Tax=Panicum hallii TaxID=206008 RepID=A0A2T8IIX4_9POAL|nr:hypothetical protein PAHAL_5G042500 [Panicum hallii]
MESSITSIAIAGTVDRHWYGRPGEFPPDTTNQIALGFMASSSFYGNDNPNLYNDGGKRKCFNLQCPGFVQTSNEIALGTSFINHGSSITYDGVPYVTMSIHKAPGQQQCFVNQVGGVVHNSRPNGAHRHRHMGNGRTPDSGSSAVATAYLTIGASGVDKVDTPNLVGVTAPRCYSAAILGENVHIPGFDVAYGGPGGRGCDQ